MKLIPENLASMLATTTLREDVVSWVENSLVLPQKLSSRPGPIDITTYTPYMRDIINSLADSDVDGIVLCCSTQVGKTLFLLIALAYAIEHAPGHAMWVKPNKDLAIEDSKEKILPWIRGNECLAAHLSDKPWDTQNKLYSMDRMNIHFASARTPGDLVSRSIRWLLMDEVSQYASGAAVHEAMERLRTYRDSKWIMASTPTGRDVGVWPHFMSSEQHQYYVPCPHCGEFQILDIGSKNIPGGLRWPERPVGVSHEEWADRVKSEGMAWYECAYCSGEIRDEHKGSMLQNGEMRCSRLLADDGDAPRKSRIVGYHINALYSRWIMLSEVAERFINASLDAGELRLFRRNWLGLPDDPRVDTVKDSYLSVITEKANYRLGSIPDDAQFVTIGVDVHGDRKGLFASVWAWSPGMRGQLVDHIQVYSWEDLDSFIRKDYVRGDGLVLPSWVGVDSGDGNKTQEVYGYCLNHPNTYATKGYLTKTQPRSESRVDYTVGRKKRKVSLLTLDTTHWKDTVAELLACAANGESRGLYLPEDTGHDFLDSLRSEHKAKRKNKNVWVPRYTGAANHYWDTVVIATAVADRRGWATLRDDSVSEGAPVSRRPAERRQRKSGWVGGGPWSL